jgi:hypothetical protein
MDKAPGPAWSALASTDNAVAFGATASMAEMTCPAGSAGPASATRRETSSFQAWCRGFTARVPPGPGGAGCPAPLLGALSPWPEQPLFARLAPVPPVLPG